MSQFLGDILNELNYTEVRLMSARSPHEFYLNICGEDYHNSYHRLRIDMRLYDNKENDQKYNIPSLLLFEGLLCAVKYPKVCNEWHRSRLLTIDKQNKCRLFLVDIGSDHKLRISLIIVFLQVMSLKRVLRIYVYY